jgi:release factor glutamine methyltransferase
MTRGEALADVTARLRDAGIDSPSRDARLLLIHAAQIEMAELIGWPERPLSDEAAARLLEFADRRCRREPVSKIFGSREFWSLDFEVTADTLDPRPDTETLVDAALKALPDRDRPLSILDLGTGSGCILLSILSERNLAWGLGVDRSMRSLKVAARNAARLGLSDRARFMVGDWDQAIAGRFDLVVSNPPYIPTRTIESLDPEVRDYDPVAALDGGIDGLDAYRILAARLGARIQPEGLVLLEIGIGQADAVSALLERVGFLSIERLNDLAGIPRVLVAGNPRDRK